MKKFIILTALFCASLSILPAQTPEFFLQMGHSNAINAVAYSPDTRRIATASDDNTIKIWDAESGREIRTLAWHTNRVSAVDFSPDGKWIVSGSWDKTIEVWNAETGQEIRTLRGHSDNVMSVAYSPDGRRIVSGSWDNTVKIWNAETGQEIRTLLGDDYPISITAYSPDGKKIISGSNSGNIKIWDAETGRELRTIIAHDGVLNSVSFSPDGRRLVSSARRPNSFKIWETETGRELLTIPVKISVYSLCFSPDGKRIVCGSGDKTVKIFDVETGRELRSLAGHGESVHTAAYSPDGRRILSGSYDNTAKVWDAETGRELLTLQRTAPAGVFRMAFSPNGKRLAAGSLDGALRIWDTESGRMLRVQRYGGQINSAHYSLDSTLLAFTVNDEKDKTVRIVNGETGAAVRSLSGHGGMVNYAAFSPDGRRVASASDDKTLKLWDAATGRELRTLSGHTEGVLCVAFSADGKRLVSGSADKTIKIWDAETGREIKTIGGPNDAKKHGGPVWSVAFSPDGTAIASASADGSFPLWDIATGTLKAEVGDDRHPTYYSMFSPDGKRVIAANGYYVYLTDASTGQMIQGINTFFAGGVYAALYSPDGKWIAAACGDGTVRLLDAADYSPWFTFIGFTGEEWLTLLPQNCYYGSANGDRYLNARLGNMVSGADRYRQNQKPAALALGMTLYKELTVQRFLEPNNRAALSRIEGRLQSIVSGSAGTATQVSRAEIEAYYQQNIGALVAAAVDAESWEEVEKVKRTVELVNITHMFTSFFLSPNQNTFNVLKSFKKIFDDAAVQYAAIDYATAASKSFADQGDKERAAQMQTAVRKGQQNITALNNSLGLPQDTRLDISGRVFDRVVNNLCPALADRLRQ